MTLPAEEFIRRFLLHVLPARFVRIRYYALLANRHRTGNLARCRELLASEATAATASAERGLAGAAGTADGQGSNPVSALWPGPPASGGGSETHAPRRRCREVSALRSLGARRFCFVPIRGS
jgi:hypothetical protein